MKLCFQTPLESSLGGDYLIIIMEVGDGISHHIQRQNLASISASRIHT